MTQLIKLLSERMEQQKLIMLIDDEPINNFIAGKIIEKYSDYGVDAYISAREALAELRTGRLPEFIFLDINMPGLNGWDFLDEYSKFPEEVTMRCPVVMLTSSIDTKDVERSRKYKCVCDFVSKPLNPENLEAVIQTKHIYSLKQR